MKLPFIASVVAALVPFLTSAQAQISPQNRKELQAAIQSDTTLTAQGVEKVVDQLDHVVFFGRVIVFEDGLTVQITYDRKGDQPGFHICWRSVIEDKPYDNCLRVSSAGKIDESHIDGLRFDPHKFQAQPTPPQTKETIPVVSSSKPPKAILVDTEQPVLTQGRAYNEYARLRTDILSRLSKQAPLKEVASKPVSKPTDKEAQKESKPKASSKKRKKK